MSHIEIALIFASAAALLFAVLFAAAVLRARRERARAEALRENLSDSAVECAVSRAEARGARERAEECSRKMAVLESEKAEAEKLLSARESELRLLRENLEQLEQSRAALHKQLNDDFQILAGKVFDSAREKFAASGAEKISALVSPLAENIADFRRRVETIHDAETRANAEVSSQIESLLKMNNRLSDDARSLAAALKANNKVAGNWGEAVLERIFESCGFIKGVHFRAQASFTDADAQQARLVPDFIVDLPDNRSIIVDSKLSLVDYVDYCSAETGEQRRQSLEKFKKSTRAHLREFAKKYDGIGGASGFKLMFMPVEPAYNLIVDADKTLLADAYRDNVIIVSPSTVMAVLKFAQIAYRNDALGKNMGALSKQGRLLCERIDRFLKTFDVLQDKINILQRAYNDTKNALFDTPKSLASTAKRFHELSLKSLEDSGEAEQSAENQIETGTENGQ